MPSSYRYRLEVANLNVFLQGATITDFEEGEYKGGEGCGCGLHGAAIAEGTPTTLALAYVLFALGFCFQQWTQPTAAAAFFIGGAIAATVARCIKQHYGATKGAVIAMSRALAVEYGKQGIRSNAILPGWIESPMTHNTLNWDRFQDAVLPRVPAGRWGEKEDFGGIAVYLTSDASRYHSGDTFVIDGAYSLF